MGICSKHIQSALRTDILKFNHSKDRTRCSHKYKTQASVLLHTIVEESNEIQNDGVSRKEAHPSYLLLLLWSDMGLNSVRFLLHLHLVAVIRQASLHLILLLHK